VTSTTDTAQAVVLHSVEANVGTITLNNPARLNSLTPEMLDGISEAVEALVDRPDVRVIVLRGAGKSFSSGLDLIRRQNREGWKTTYEMVRQGQQDVKRLVESSKPVIAELKGYTLGGMCEFVLSAADMRVASDDTIMSLPEIDLALMPDIGGLQSLVMLSGLSRAKYVAMSGDRINASQALTWGMVDWVVPFSELETFTANLAAKLAAKAPIPLGMIKQQANDFFGGAYRSGLNAAHYSQVALGGFEDFKEAGSAIVEKRRPVFRGR